MNISTIKVNRALIRGYLAVKVCTLLNIWFIGNKRIRITGINYVASFNFKLEAEALAFKLFRVCRRDRTDEPALIEIFNIDQFIPGRTAAFDS